eukprot:scaffold151999_cov14-Tisochrysis_lutea.AAC.1
MTRQEYLGPCCVTQTVVTARATTPGPELRYQKATTQQQKGNNTWACVVPLKMGGNNTIWACVVSTKRDTRKRQGSDNS